MSFIFIYCSILSINGLLDLQIMKKYMDKGANLKKNRLKLKLIYMY
jgi:hypothetical protein